MYISNKYENGQTFFAADVPPEYNEKISEDFNELSKIHFHLGSSSLDKMMSAVENASLEEIDRGRVQILFALKQMQDYLCSSWSDIKQVVDKKHHMDDFFINSFNRTLDDTMLVLNEAYQSPAKDSNAEKIKVMILLTLETEILHQELMNTGKVLPEISKKVDEVKEKYAKLLALREHYPNLQTLKAFEDYRKEALNSLKTQLSNPNQFDYEICNRHMPANIDSPYQYIRLSGEKQKEREVNGQSFDEKEVQELKDDFMKQFKSFNSLFMNGAIHNINYLSIGLSREAFLIKSKTMADPAQFYERELYNLRKLVERNGKKSKYGEELEKFEAKKEQFIQQKVDDKKFLDQYLTNIYRNQVNISQSLEKVSANLLNTKLKDAIVFEGNIFEGFVVGKMENSDKVLLVHKDDFVEHPGAVYAMVLPKEQYESLVKENKLIFAELRESLWESASNFWSYGQFLQEITSPSIQKFFLGKEFDLIDKTTMPDFQKEKVKNEYVTPHDSKAIPF